MVHPAQMHQLVHKNVIPDRRRHQHQSPVQADMPVRAARAPSAALVTDAHARDDEAMPRGELQQAWRQFAASLFATRTAIVVRRRLPLQARTLPRDPFTVSSCKGFRLATRAASRDGDSYSSV
jgi:hypothetical protein